MNRKADFGAISAALFVVAVQYSRNFENSLKGAVLKHFLLRFHRLPRRNGRSILKVNAKIGNIEHVSHLDPLWTRIQALMVLLPHY